MNLPVVDGDDAGLINIFDPKSFQAPLVRVKKHKAQVTCSEFSSVEKGSHLLATGGCNNEIYVTDLKSPQAPSAFTPDPNTNAANAQPQGNAPGMGQASMRARTSCVAWNSQVVHVLASGSSNGVVNVWDLRQKAAWCVLRDAKGAGFVNVKWNPLQGLYLMTATNDDMQPVLKLWDLRRSTTAPLTEFVGHTKAVLAFDWCRFDDMIVSSYAKDNKFLVWDLFSGKPVVDVNDPAGQLVSQEAKLNESFASMNVAGGAAQMGGLAGLGFENSSSAVNAGDVFSTFGGTASAAASSGSEKALFVKFSPTMAPIVLAQGVQEATGSPLSIYSVHAFGSLNYQTKYANGIDVSGNCRAPKWCQKTSALNFGFCGKLTEILPPTAEGHGIQLGFVADKVSQQFSTKGIELEQELASVLNGEVTIESFCEGRAQSSADEFTSYFWSVLPLLSSNVVENRSKLTSFLGFDHEKTKQLINTRLGVPEEADGGEEFDIASNRAVDGGSQIGAAFSSPAPPATPSGLQSFSEFGDGGGNAADFFGNNSSASFSQAAEQESNEKKGTEMTLGGEESPVSAKQPSRAEGAKQVERVVKVLEDADTEELVKKCLFVGDFASGTRMLLKNQRFADALVLSTCGGEELWTEAVDAYLANAEERSKLSGSHKSKISYASIVGAVLNEDLVSLVKESQISLENWKDHLVVIAQYGKPEEFHELCGMLGDKLLAISAAAPSVDYFKPTILCYLLSQNVSKVISCLVTYHSGLEMEAKRKDKVDYLEAIILSLLALNLVFQQIGAGSVFVDPEAIKLLLEFSTELVHAGQLDYAARFLMEIEPREVSAEEEHAEVLNELYTELYALNDRIYGAHPSPEESLHHFIPQRWFPYAVLEPSNLINYEGPTESVVDPVLAQEPIGYSEPAAASKPITTEQYPPSANLGYQGRSQPVAGHGMTRATPPSAGNQFGNHFSGAATERAAPHPPQTNVSGGQRGSTAYSAQIAGPGMMQSQYSQPAVSQPASVPSQAKDSRFGAGNGFGSQRTTVPPIPLSTAPLQTPPARAAGSGQKQRSPRIPLNDGFGTTVGNPLAGQKYGNVTHSNLEVDYSQPGAPQEPPHSQFHETRPATRRRSSVGSSVSNYDQQGNLIPGPSLSSTTVFNPNHTGQAQAPLQPQAEHPGSASHPTQPRPSAYSNPAPQAQLSDRMKKVLQSFENLVNILGNFELSNSERKYLELGRKSVEILRETCLKGGVSEDLESELEHMARTVDDYDFASANQLKLSITRHHWTEQKEWLKGFSQLISLSHKKYPSQQ